MEKGKICVAQFAREALDKRTKRTVLSTSAKSVTEKQEQETKGTLIITGKI